MDDEQGFPVIRQTVLDTTDPRRLAEFYRQLFGLRYCPGDEPPGPGQPDPKGQDWLILTSSADGAALAFQKVDELPGATWPDGPVPQQLHLDTTVPTMADLDVAHERALALGARLLEDRSDDPEEPLRVYADPAGHQPRGEADERFGCVAFQRRGGAGIVTFAGPAGQRAYLAAERVLRCCRTTRRYRVSAPCWSRQSQRRGQRAVPG